MIYAVLSHMNLVFQVEDYSTILYQMEQDIKISNFTHTLVKNRKEIQIFDKNMAEYFLSFYYLNKVVIHQQ